ncbi:hypothetical protein CEQ90_15995 [Lewinellaceae bacterium SD302]|nr:hypothetical protein CEQ90_15995 [Lewinellaceae bacterium SD302]
MGGFSGLRAEVPFVNDLVSHDHPTSTQLFNAAEPIPFLGAMLQAQTDQQYAGQTSMMPCLDIITVGDDQSLCFGDTATLIGLAVEGLDTFQGTWFVLEPGGSGLDDDGVFTNVDGSPASELIVPGSNLYQSNSVSGRDTMRFSRGMMDDPNRTDYLVVFSASGSCGTSESDTMLVRFDLEPNLTLDVNSGGTTQTLETGAFPVGAALSGAYCSGSDLELVPSVINNPTLSGKPVFLRVELVDTAGLFGFGATPPAGDTFNIPLPAFEVDTILQNLGDEDKVASIKLRPYHETDGDMTDPNSTYNEGIDIIGDSIEFDLVVFSEPIASFGGNDTICFDATVPLDFTGTPNTRVFYRDTITMTTDSVDLNALGNSQVIFNNVTTNLYFVIDSLVRLDPPFCAASPATIAGIAAQPFIVLDSIGVTTDAVDSIACDTLSIVSFDFFANDSASVYSFSLTNNIDGFDSTYVAQGEDTLSINLAELNFGGMDAPRTITFYVSGVVDTSSTANCDNPILQDSFVIFVDPEPAIRIGLAGNSAFSDDTPMMLFDTFCITDDVAFSGIITSDPAASGLPLYVRQIDSVYNVETNVLISVDTVFLPVDAAYMSNATLVADNPDSIGFVRRILPYFESDAANAPVDYDDDSECSGGEVRLEILLTPAPLEPVLAFSTDTICGMPGSNPDILITGGTPGATVSYVTVSNGVNGGVSSTILDVNGEATISYTPVIDSGMVVARLQATFTECARLLSQSDTLIVKPRPTGTITALNDSICLTDTAYVVFNTDFSYNGVDSLELRYRIIVPGDASGPATDLIVRDGDTIFSGLLPDDRVFQLERLRHVFGMNCTNQDDVFDTIYVDNEPQLMIDVSEVSVSPLTMATVTTDPMGMDSVYVETCAADSLFLIYGVPNAMTDTSQFNDSLYVALTIVDPLGVTPAGIGTTTVYFDIDEPGAYDTLSLINNTNDTARIELTAVPFFYDPSSGLTPAGAFSESCQGDTVKITIDVINNFVSTIGGNYILCTGTDTVVLITGPDFAEVDYVAIFENAMGDQDTSMVRTVVLDGLGRFEIEIDSILADTTYDLIAARLPGSGCEANLGPNIDVTVIPVPIATFDSTTLMVCEGTGFSTTLMGPPEGFARITNNLNGDSEFVSFNDDSVAIFTFDSLVGDITFYVDSIINDTTGLNPVCVTDTITDSLMVIQLAAPTAELVSDTICFGDTAYVTFSTTMLMDSFDVEILVAGGTTFTLNDVMNGDTVAQLNGLTADSTAVFLQSAQILNTSMCFVLPLGADVDTAYVRVDTLPQISTTFTEPFDLTVDANTVNDTIVMCYEEVVTNTITIDPMTSIAGNGAMVFGNAMVRVGNAAPFPLLGPDFSVPPSALEFSMFDVAGALGNPSDSIIIDFEVQAYLPSSMGASYDPATDCIGDTATFTLIVLPQPTAIFSFASDPICESEITPISILGNPGDTVLFAVEGLGTFNVVIPADGSFEYMMPSVADIEAAILSTTGMANDDQIAFAIVNVLSATNPSCDGGGSAFSPLSVQFLDIERLMRVDLTIADTTVCTGTDAVLNFSGMPNATFEATFDYADDNLDNQQTLMLDGMGALTVIIPNFRDTLTVSIDSVFSGSGLMCLDTSMVDTFPTIFSIPLPDANFSPDTVCNNGSVDVIFDYTGESMAAAGDTFEVSYTDQNGMAQLDTLEDGETVTTLMGSGTYTFTILAVTDLQTGCDTTYMGGLTQTFVIEDAPAFQVEFTGGVNNGVVFDTDMPFTFPNPGITSVCSGTNLTTDVIGMNSSSDGDPTYARLIITQDPLGVFGPGAVPRTEFVPLSTLELNTLLVNNTTSVQNVAFSWTAYFETNTAVPNLDAGECIGGTQNFLIRVAPNPMAEFTNMDTMRVCRGDDVFIKFSGTDDATVSFTDDNGNVYTSVVGPNDSVSIDTDIPGPDTIRFGIDTVGFTFPVVNLNCTSTPTDSFVLIINEFPIATLEFMANDTVCFNESVEVVFRSMTGIAPYEVTVNGMNFTDVRDGDTLFNSGPLTMNTNFTITSASDSNGCMLPMEYLDSVVVDEVPLLSTDIELFSLTNSSLGTETLVDGELELDTFCSLQRLEFTGMTTSTNNAGDPVWVRVELTGDVNAIWPAYLGDTIFFLPFGDLGSALDMPAIANNSNMTIEADIFLTPYFESDPFGMMPMIDGAECSGAEDTLSIAIDPRPNANPTFFDDEICSGDTFTFDLSTAIDNFQMGTTFSYTTSSTGTASAAPRPVSSEDDIADVITNISTNRDTVTYVVTPFSPSGCEGGDFEIEVIVRPEPVLIANADTICSNSESMLEVTRQLGVINPTSYIVTDVVFDADSLTAIDVITPVDTFDRTVSVPGEDNLFIRDEFVNISFDTQRVDYYLVPLRNGTGCTGDTVVFSLYIAPEPLLPAGLSDTVCTDVRLAIDLQETVLNGVASDFIWEFESADPFIEGITMGPQTNGVINDSLRLSAGAGTQVRRVTYRVEAVGQNGCPLGVPDTFLYDVFISPQILLSIDAPGSDFICTGESNIIVEANASNTIGMVNYNWFVTDQDPGVTSVNIINPTGNGSSVSLEAIGNGQFTINVEVDDDGGCTAIASRTVTVYDELVASFDTTTVGLSTVDFFDTSEGFPTQWMWIFDDPASGNADTSMVQNPTHTFTAPGTYDVSLQVIRQAFCPDTATVIQQVFVGFTPVARIDTVILNEGFNIISFDVDPSNDSITSVFGDVIANGNLVDIFSVDPNSATQFETFDPNLPPVFNSLDIIRPGFGYFVEMAPGTTDTIFLPGLTLDPQLRIDLRAGFNFVAYLYQQDTFFNSYFDDLIINPAFVDALTYENSVLIDYDPNPLFNPLDSLHNGLGYVIETNASLDGSVYRSDEPISTSNLEFLFGYTDLTDAVGQRINILDEDRNYRGHFVIGTDGILMPQAVFGDLAHTSEVEGMLPGTKLLFEYNNQLLDINYIFQGDWSRNLIELNFGETVSSTNELDAIGDRWIMSPNPSFGNVAIDFHSASFRQELTIEVMNAYGQVVTTRQFEALSEGKHRFLLDLTKNQSGMYLVRIAADGEVIGTESLILQ